VSTRARTIVRIVALTSAALVIAWLGATGFMTHRLLARERAPYSEPVPAALEQRVECARIATRDHEELGAWWSGDAETKIAVLVLHGNHGSRGEAAPLVGWLAERGIGVLALTLRAHGDSTGDVNDAGWSARGDVLAGVAFIESRAPHARVVILGRSLGAASAVFAARELGERVAAYVLDSPYRDLASAAHARLRRALPAIAADAAYAGMLLTARLSLSTAPDAVSPLERIVDVPPDVPIVFLSGTADDRAPTADVEAMAARARGPTEIIRFAGADHVSLFVHDRARFEAALEHLFAGLERPVLAR
jgi:alpha-beta hydrolase superfamily lysophospholipase